MSNEESILILNDEEGNEQRFEFLDLLEYEGEEYIVLLPADNPEAREVLILKIEPDAEDEDLEHYLYVEDHLAEILFGIFKEKYANVLKFEDDTEE